MEQYIGTKIVHGEHMTKGNAEKHLGHPVASGEDNNANGYLVEYEGGYQSWSPRDAFENAYKKTNGMTFGFAIEAVKLGKKVCRKGWNGKGQYIELATHVSYMNPDNKMQNVNHDQMGNKAIAFVGTSGIQLGWLASQADMLADDWQFAK
ncbi:DUF2829 domain-containing protein [Megasphaera paucivorans]|uniref:Thoeris anti-defense 2-like domain-containing protein n=1 Tax=Megasphaera paucivorans TaxID=349095 RepID=A0A1G9QCP8_9FIRM|nr:DUF2829 domain-containing protein [Megasphaera paucivorans]SDM08680.1 Protein of unknown function [Megasphaera paucivorans]